MKSTFKLLLLLMTLSFIACDKNEDDFSKKTVICMYGTYAHGMWVRKVNFLI